MNVKDTRKLEEFEQTWRSASGGKAFRSEVVGQEAKDLAKEQIQKRRSLGHDGSGTEVQVRNLDSTGPTRRQTRNKL